MVENEYVKVETQFSFDIDNNPMYMGQTALTLTNAVCNGVNITLNKKEDCSHMTLTAVGEHKKVLHFLGNLYNVSDLTEDMLYNVYGIQLKEVK
jgi:hypothetical protein